MPKLPNVNSRVFLSLLLVLMLALNITPSQRAIAATPAQGNGETNKDDPCTHVPDPPGQAKGIDKQCPEGGTSSGVVKGDFNNDGYADLAIGEPNATIAGQAGAGDVVVLYGSANGLTASGKNLWYEGPDRDIPGSPQAGDAFGTALASGDFNGDGFSDLAIGIPNKTMFGPDVDLFTEQPIKHLQAGAVVVIYGSPNGLTTTDSNFPKPQFLNLGFAGFEVVTDVIVPDGAHFGQSLAWGNFNGDNFNGNPIGDLAIGIPDAASRSIPNSTFLDIPQDGAVFVIAGAARFGFDLVGRESVFFQENGATQSGQRMGERFGASMASGDFNGDGLDDLAVGAPGRSIGPYSGNTCTGTCATAAGEVEVVITVFGVFNENVHFLSADNTGLTGGAQSNDRFGSALASGDFDGNGESDLAIGVPGKNIGGGSHSGTVAVSYGLHGSGLTLSGIQAWDEISAGGTDDANDRFGTALAAGDFNGDGFLDLAVGVPFKLVAGEVNAGEVDVFYGSSASGLSTSHAPQRWNQQNAFPKTSGGASAGNHFGSTLTAWNFGRDEAGTLLGHPIVHRTADLAVGSPLQTVERLVNGLFQGISGAGAVDVMYGSFASNGLTGLDPKGGTVNTFFTADSIGFKSTAGGHFGAALY